MYVHSFNYLTSAYISRFLPILFMQALYNTIDLWMNYVDVEK